MKLKISKKYKKHKDDKMNVHFLLHNGFQMRYLFQNIESEIASESIMDGEFHSHCFLLLPEAELRLFVFISYPYPYPIPWLIKYII